MDYDFNNAVFLNYSLDRRCAVPPLREMRLPYLDITYCIEGRMEYIIDGEPVVLTAGDAILFPPGSVRTRAFTDIPNYYASFNIQFPESFMTPIRGKVPKCIFPDTVNMLEIFKKSFQSISLFSKEKCFGIFSYIYNQILEAALDKENVYVKQTKQYVISNLARRLTLNMIADEVHLEPHYLCSLFKQQTGMTVIQYIINQRIELAKHLIVTHDEKLYTIAERCGFDNYNHFSNTFKKINGVTAIQYRNSIHANKK